MNGEYWVGIAVGALFLAGVAYLVQNWAYRRQVEKLEARRDTTLAKADSADLVAQLTFFRFDGRDHDIEVGWIEDELHRRGLERKSTDHDMVEIWGEAPWGETTVCEESGTIVNDTVNDPREKEVYTDGDSREATPHDGDDDEGTRGPGDNLGPG